MTTKPKVKLSRSLGIPLTPKAARIMAKKARAPGARGAKGRRPRMSDYKVRLVEKQKLRAQYNIRERQMFNYFVDARNRARGIPELTTGDVLVQLLETRLDAVVQRAGFANTIYAARQLVSHGHIQVNGKKVDVPSYTVKVDEVVAVKPASRNIPTIIDALASSAPPAYLERDKDNFSVKLLFLPKRADVPVLGELPLVVEFYSR